MIPKVAVSLFLGVLTLHVEARAQTVTACDELASHPADSGSVGSGIEFSEIDAPSAISACEQARREYPDQPRFTYLLGRSTHASGDVAEAVRLYKVAAREHYPFAVFTMAKIYAGGATGYDDPEEAFHWNLRAANLGFLEPKGYVGIALIEGRGVGKDEEEGIQWIKEAAEEGYADAQLFLSTVFANGELLPKDLDESVRWLEEAAESGHPVAIDILNAFGD
ncbi:tetratricopeptide repeat protein [Inquilinus sp. CAU 1745]|uniref:tetratricopeptide repeat protein n=1 Tax=Inquilinus sp. CAU 1745 TaxID=3140369 RepID=UPI00325C1A76